MKTITIYYKDAQLSVHQMVAAQRNLQPFQHLKNGKEFQSVLRDNASYAMLLAMPLPLN